MISTQTTFQYLVVVTASAICMMSSVVCFSTSQLPQCRTVAVSQHRHQQTPLFMSSSSDANPLGVVSESTSVDPFDVYEQNDSQALAVKDFVVGKGTTVESGNLLTLKYKARFLATGKQFDESESYVCRVGKGKIIPGFDQGLMNMKVGGKRTIRIPPSLAYGDEWFKGVIPPKSHLEFECELLSIAQSPQEEFMVQLEDFGVARAAGMLVLGTYLAISPMLN